MIQKKNRGKRIIKKIGIIGGGAAGFYAALNLKERCPDYNVTILEKADRFLQKVKISGGGRCNITNSCPDIKNLALNYPRGGKELLSVFSKHSNLETIDWFESRGIKLKTESDGRIFPVSDNSETIVNFFLQRAKDFGIITIKKFNVDKVIKENNFFRVCCGTKEEICDAVLISSGGLIKKDCFISELGHKIELPVPSLFTFNTDDDIISGLSGISISEVEVCIDNTNYCARGSILITHNGLSGPAILRLSSFAARYLNSVNYEFLIRINFVAEATSDDLYFRISKLKNEEQFKNISSKGYFNIPHRLWDKFVISGGINPRTKWKDIPKSSIRSLAKEITRKEIFIKGKSTNKEEFVTCGGVSLKEINFKTMESRLIPDLYFAGEVLDIDGITGGFNFQSAWSTAHVFATSV